MISCVKDLSEKIGRDYRHDRLSASRYRFLTATVEIRSNSVSMMNLLDRIYHLFRTPGVPDSSIMMYLLEETGPKTVYTAIDPGFDSFRCSDPSLAVSFWGAQLLCNHLYRSGFLFVHGATLERDEKAFLFPGGSRSGKTTLACSLRETGFSFLSDEFSPLDQVSGAVFPFPRSFLLREKSQGPIFPHDQLPFFFDHQEMSPNGLPARRFIVSPERVYSSIGEQPVKPGALFFLGEFSGTESGCRPIPAVTALEMLLDHSVNPPYLDPAQAAAAIEMLVALLGKIPAFVLYPGPPGESPEKLTSLIVERAATGKPIRPGDLQRVARRCRELMRKSMNVQRRSA